MGWASDASCESSEPSRSKARSSADFLRFAPAPAISGNYRSHRPLFGHNLAHPSAGSCKLYMNPPLAPILPRRQLSVLTNRLCTQAASNLKFRLMPTASTRTVQTLRLQGIDVCARIQRGSRMRQHHHVNARRKCLYRGCPWWFNVHLPYKGEKRRSYITDRVERTVAHEKYSISQATLLLSTWGILCETSGRRLRNRVLRMPSKRMLDPC